MRTLTSGYPARILGVLLSASWMIPGVAASTTQDVNRLRGLKIETERGPELVELYSASYALLIGNGDYEHWDRLEWPTQDVDDIAEQLRRLRFETEVHKNLTEQEFREVTGRFLATRGREQDAQLLIYYAGHGHTEKGARGRSFGYIVMTDTPLPQQDYGAFEARSVSMDWFLTYARKLESRHVLFVFDSCFSGTVLNVRSQLAPKSIQRSIAGPVREFLTAGSADEPVPDQSIFKSVLLKVLNGSIDEPIPDGYLTGEELGLVMKTTVPEYYPNQHPQFGKILDPELDEGDFVFILNPTDDVAGFSRDVPQAVDDATRATVIEAKRAYDAGERDRALALFHQAASSGHGEAMTYVGFIHYEREDYENALEWFKRAAERGDASAMNNLGFLYKQGLGTTRNYAEAARWLERAARAGESGAMYNLGHMYQTGQGVAEDMQKAYKLLTSAAEAGDERAMNDLAFLYQHGQGVDKNIPEAIRWYQSAVDAGDAAAMVNLGRLYFEGYDTPVNIAAARSLFERSARAGNPSAMNYVGHMIKEGIGVPADSGRAVEWFNRGALAGNTSAMNNLAYMYEKGIGIAQSYETALHWYLEGAKLEHPGAMFNLARVHELGLGTDVDRDEAIRWYRAAAELGDDHASERLQNLTQRE